MSIVTENEKYGSGFLDESAPGAWVVAPAFPDIYTVFSNREAAEAYIRDKEASGPVEYSLSVWTINDTYPFPEDE